MNAEALVLSRPRAADFAALTKPGITVMVTVTAALGFAAAGGAVGLALLHAVVGTALAAAGANALNMVLERDSDARMRRTENRPLPAGRLQPIDALLFATILSSGGMLYLTFLVNPLAGALAAFTIATYAFVYTPLKKITTLNTLVGAVPGAVPPLIGWAAASGELAPGALMLFLVMFFWQMPHFLAIAWIYREDYARAGHRMLTVDDPDGRATGLQAVLYTAGLGAASMAPALLGLAGREYLACALALGVGLLWFAIRFALKPSRPSARRLFFASNLYLPLILTFLAIGG